MATIKRSPAHPTLNLAQAIERARRLHQAFHEHWMPIDGVATSWGLSAKSSGFLQYLSTLKQFGLISEQGANEGREFKLTDVALDLITYPEGSDEFREAAQHAALDPHLHGEIWSRFSENLPPEDTAIRVYLVRQREQGTFHPEQVDAFIRQLRETLAFAGLPGPATIQRKDNPVTPSVGAFVQWTSNGADQFQEPRRVEAISEDGNWVFVEGASTGVPMSEIAVVDPPKPPQQPLGQPPVNPNFKPPALQKPPSGIKEDVYTSAEGDFVLRWPEKASVESVDEFEEWVKLMIRKIKRISSSSSSSSSSGA